MITELTFSQALAQFHFLRPLWLLAILPAVLLIMYFWRQKSSAANWRGAINESLLSHLIEGGSNKSHRWPWLVLLLAWLLSAVSMAGPTWQKMPQPVVQKQDALVIVLDLSLSMLVEDVKPSRLVRARHKILDILAQREEGLTGLIAYSGDAHVVSPLTDDTGTIANLTPALSPTMMPVFGSAPTDAIEQAQQLFSNSGITQGRILLITDAISEENLDEIDDSIKRSGFELSIMGIGTEDGAPIPSKEGFLKDNDGNIVVPKLPRSVLESLARRNNGRYTDASLSDKDIEFLLAKSATELDSNTLLTEREFDQWHDRGAWLAILLLPLSLLAFRRGWLLLLPLCILFDPQTAHALSWQDLWQRTDQQASDILSEGNAAEAAEQFNNPEWKASAQYRAGDFEAAAQNFAQFDSANSHYNRGNALAKAGKLDEAIEAYNQALQQQPDMEDAQANKALVEQLKQQQEQQSQQSDQSEGEPSEQDQQGQSDQQQSSQQQSGESKSEDSQSEQSSSDNQNPERDPSQQQSPNQEKSSDQENADPESSQAEQPQDERSEHAQSEQEESQNSAEAQSDSQSSEPPPEEQSAQAQSQPKELSPEEQQRQQAMEQWLRKIPDDPSGLLRRKFDYEYRLRQQQGKQNREQPLW